MSTTRSIVIQILSKSSTNVLISSTAKLLVYTYFIALSTFWFYQFGPSMKFKAICNNKTVSKNVVGPMIGRGFRHFFYSCLFFIGVRSLLSVSQTVATETQNVKFSFFHILSPRFILPTLNFGDYLAIDIAIFLCKGIFTFTNTLYVKEFGFIEYAISSVVGALLFIFFSITSLSVLHPSRLIGMVDPSILNTLLSKLNVYFCWIILPCIYLFNAIPLRGSFDDLIELGLYSYFILALVGAPSYAILSSLEEAGGISVVTNTTSFVQLLHSIMYGLTYSFGYKALYMLNSIINSYFDSDVAPFNPLADDLSGSVVNRLFFLKF